MSSASEPSACSNDRAAAVVVVARAPVRVHAEKIQAVGEAHLHDSAQHELCGCAGGRSPCSRTNVHAWR